MEYSNERGLLTKVFLWILAFDFFKRCPIKFNEQKCTTLDNDSKWFKYEQKRGAFCRMDLNEDNRWRFYPSFQEESSIIKFHYNMKITNKTNNIIGFSIKLSLAV